ncbi:MAG: hypothetical protein IRY99_13785 [Isosphaeraceae bacterium]|nr:hypothetical protein [Isosphaeraceae bacterium]
MSDIHRPHLDDGCEVCHDNDHCLPRWEDDGGMGPPDAGWPPSLAQASKEAPHRDGGYQDWPYDEEAPHQPL